MDRKTIFQIAIDGPAASGKSTAARLLAERLGGYYINTGDMYRTLSWAALQQNLDMVNHPESILPFLKTWDMHYQIAAGKPQLYFNGEAVKQEDIRAPQVAAIVSYTARIPEVRSWMVERQRECCSLGIIIMEGRDIATVILPDARYKFFVTASPEERARRRLAQSDEVTAGATLEKVIQEITERDRIDSTRKVAPLKPAEDSVIIMTDGMSREQVIDEMVSHIHC